MVVVKLLLQLGLGCQRSLHRSLLQLHLGELAGSRRGRKDGEEGMVGVVEKTTMLPQLGLGYQGSLHMSQQHGGVGDWEEAWRRDGGGEAAAAVGPRLPRVLAQVTAEASPGGLGSRRGRKHAEGMVVECVGGGEDHHAAAVGPRLPRVLVQVTAAWWCWGLGTGMEEGCWW